MPVRETHSTRERLLEAAGQVFGEHGYQGATVRQICRRATANVGAINYHFGDKHHLYCETLAFAFRQLAERHPPPQTWPEETPVTQRLRDFVAALLARLLSAGEGWHGPLIARELAVPTGALQEVAESYMRPQFATLDRIIASARPDLDEDRRHLHVLGLIGQCVFFRHARPVLDVLYGPESFGPDQIPLLTEHIVRVFLLGLELPATGEGGAQ